MRVSLVTGCLLIAISSRAFAQHGVVAGGSLTTAIGNDRVGRMASLDLGYQLGRHWRAAFEVAHAPKLAPHFVHILNSGPDDAWTDATTFTGKLRVDLRSSGRWVPFVAGGLGIARVTDAFTVVYIAGSGILPGPNPVRSTSVERALSAGGGVSVLASTRLSLDLDANWLGIGPEPVRSFGRFGAGLSYRF